MSRISLRRMVATASLLVAGSDVSAQAVPAAAPQAPVPGRRSPLVLSAAGGISKGAYQAGVNWTIIEALRDQRRTGRQVQGAILTREDGRWDASNEFYLAAATGASAGNINALLSAIAWCTDAVRRPDGSYDARIRAEESLLWKMWVNTGISELMPEILPRDERPAGARPDRELAAFDRTYFAQVLRPQVLSGMAEARGIAGCSLPIGITMTRLQPVDMKVAGSVTARVQRYASVFRLESELRNGNHELRLVHPGATTTSSRSLGALALAPTLDNPASTQSDRFDEIFEFVLASSSFPVAFAPKRIVFTPAGMQPAVPTMRDTSLFSDGGAFDNNPFALALRLYEIDAKGDADSVGAIYANPNALRAPFGDDRLSAPRREQRSGLGSNFQLLGGIYAAAGEYELQSLGRTIARDEELQAQGVADITTARPRILRSTRSTPIFGEHLGSFAAFLGRAMREYDFYGGAYDGLEFVARNMICVRAAEQAVDGCVRHHHNEMARNNVLQLDSIGRSVVEWHRAREYGNNPAGGWQPPRNLSPQESARLLLLLRIHVATGPLYKHPFMAECEMDILAAQLCKTGLDTVLFTLREDDDAQAAATALLDWCLAGAPGMTRQLGECSVDRAFKALLDDPEHHLNNMTEIALDNLLDAEDKLRKQKLQATELSPWVEVGHAVLRGGNESYRRGLEVNPSSARIVWNGKSNALRSALTLALPNYMMFYSTNKTALSAGRDSAGIRRTGGIALGWHPFVYYTSGRIDFVTAVEGFMFRADQKDDGGLEVSPGLLLRTRWGGKVVELGGFYAKHQLGVMTGEELDRQAFGHLGIGLLGNRIKTTVRVGVDRPTMVSFGIGDINGILSWWMR